MPNPRQELRTRKDGEAVEGDFRLDLKEVLRQEGGEQEGEWFVQASIYDENSRKNLIFRLHVRVQAFVLIPLTGSRSKMFAFQCS